MHALLIISVVVIGLIFIVGVVAYIQHRLHPNGYEVSREQVRAELQKILDGHDRYALDDFISSGTFKDSRLEVIRVRVVLLDKEFPPESKDQYCSPKGIEVIRGFIRELEHETAA